MKVSVMSKIPADFNLPQFVRDVLSPNQYRLDDRFVLRDGKRHPFAILCPGGAYWMVCSYIEGVPIARKLNKAGYSAFILHYRTKEKALYPAPQDDLAMAVKDMCLSSPKCRVGSKKVQSMSIESAEQGHEKCRVWALKVQSRVM